MFKVIKRRQWRRSGVSIVDFEQVSVSWVVKYILNRDHLLRIISFLTYSKDSMKNFSTSVR